MISIPSPTGKPSNSQISQAAKGIAAAQFALSGFDVLERASRRFFFDLSVAKSGGTMKISVHASLNGFWDLADGYLDHGQRAHMTAADYHRAIDRWLEHQSAKVICCLVQFELVSLQHMPQVYLALPGEVAAQMHEKIDQLAHEELGAPGLDVVHSIQGLPSSWRFSQARIAELMGLQPEESSLAARFSAATVCKGCAASFPQACTQCLPKMN